MPRIDDACSHEKRSRRITTEHATLTNARRDIHADVTNKNLRRTTFRAFAIIRLVVCALRDGEIVEWMFARNALGKIKYCRTG